MRERCRELLEEIDLGDSLVVAREGEVRVMFRLRRRVAGLNSSGGREGGGEMRKNARGGRMMASSFASDMREYTSICIDIDVDIHFPFAYHLYPVDLALRICYKS
jgi:hypothetical protein